MNSIADLRNHIERQKGKRDQISQSLSDLKQSLLEKKKELRRHEQAREIVKVVGLATQQQLQFHISNITSLALEAVFDNPYELVAEFVQRRNKTECDLYFQRDKDNQIDPLSASGGGAVDVASFALRIASWSMQRPKSRAVLILDEPFRYLSTDLLSRASLMLQEVSQKLGLQIIMVTHSEELMEEADKVFKVSMKKNISMISSD